MARGILSNGFACSGRDEQGMNKSKARLFETHDLEASALLTALEAFHLGQNEKKQKNMSNEVALPMDEITHSILEHAEQKAISQVTRFDKMIGFPSPITFSEQSVSSPPTFLELGRVAGSKRSFLRTELPLNEPHLKRLKRFRLSGIYLQEARDTFLHTLTIVNGEIKTDIPEHNDISFADIHSLWLERIAPLGLSACIAKALPQRRTRNQKLPKDDQLFSIRAYRVQLRHSMQEQQERNAKQEQQRVEAWQAAQERLLVPRFTAFPSTEEEEEDLPTENIVFRNFALAAMKPVRQLNFRDQVREVTQMRHVSDRIWSAPRPPARRHGPRRYRPDIDGSLTLEEEMLNQRRAYQKA